MNINKLAIDIISTMADIDLFSKKVGETIKNNGLSFTFDRNWILKFLKGLTGEDWVLHGNDFVTASKK